MTENISLLVMAAGMGSRYGGLKQLDPVGPSGEVLLDYAVYDAKQAGIARVVFLIRKDLEADFRKAIGKRYEGKLEVDYAFQELHDLREGLKFWSQAEWWLRMDEGRGGSLLPKPGTDLERLARACGETDGASLMRKAEQTAGEVRKAFEKVTAGLLSGK